MSVSIKRFMDLKVGERVLFNEKHYSVNGFEPTGHINAPILIEEGSGERLYGAIYICHLLSIHVSADSSLTAHEQQLSSVAENERNDGVDFTACAPADLTSALADEDFCHVLSDAELIPEMVSPRPLLPSHEDYLIEIRACFK